MLDSAILIEHFRARNKENTCYTRAVRDYDTRLISVVTKLEILRGSRAEITEYWNAVFATMEIVPFTDDMVAKAHDIILELKRKNQLIEMEDIMIAATAISRGLPLATLNRKHFERIEGLVLVDGETTEPQS